MPWKDIPLNDDTGTSIPGLAFGTAFIPDPTALVEQALELGFSHVDTAQNYLDEAEVGLGVRQSGLPRSEVFVTTKFSGGGPQKLSIKASAKESLAKLGLTYVDLYLIHWPQYAVPDIPTAWKELEGVKAAGQARSIGVSNFSVADLTLLLASATVKPAVNQISLNPYNYAAQKPIIEFSKKHGIVVEAYSPLIPLRRPGGPLDKPLSSIAAAHKATPEQILLAWSKAKGAVPVTTSSKKERLVGYLAAGDIELSEEDIAAIDEAGAQGLPSSLGRDSRRSLRQVVVLLAVMLLLGWVQTRCLSA
uniref:NADP-dependent oxidoreductase domain-containing protein n=1 Tax=Mycena chlorophos TaxID=658473 RepID=A0ABQ0KX29_MYCCL|nr:predicted protein [Mycena chlorophos]